MMALSIARLGGKVMRYGCLAAIVLALTGLGGSVFADTLTLKCSFVGLIPQDITYNVNRDTKEVEVIGKFGTHKGVLLSNTEGFFYVLEPNLGASVATIIYSKQGETPVGIRSMLGLLNEDQFPGIPDDLKLSSETLRFMAMSVKGRCEEQASEAAQAPSQSEPKIAETGTWGPWPSDLTAVAAGFKHDDGGALIIQCDKTKRFMSYVLEEPRAHWQKGAPISVTTKADDGATTGPSAGVVIGPTRLVVGEQSTWDIVTMGNAKTFFAIGDGVHARVFPTANFRTALDPVLRACGDHW
jgi:hypothetical protein